MRKIRRLAGTVTPVALLLALLALAIIPVPAVAGHHVEWVIHYDPAVPELPEGIAVDKVGNIYVGLDLPGQIRKITPDGSESLFYGFGIEGVVGLAVDAPGNVYACLTTFDPTTQGVYRVSRDGMMAERLPGTESISFPNSLAFDKRGNLYVTDTIWGAVWRIPPRGSAEVWLQHELLEGLNLPELPFPFPLGANGIAYRQGNIYVANTEKAHIVRIPVLKDGSAGEPEIVVASLELFVLDGIALDVHGNIYALVIAQSKLVRVTQDGEITALATAEDGLDFPASLAFGTGKGARQSVFVTNYAIGPPGGPGPGVLKVDAGIPGLPVP
jgi:sugar lactone lactonase YvrE